MAALLCSAALAWPPDEAGNSAFTSGSVLHDVREGHILVEGTVVGIRNKVVPAAWEPTGESCVWTGYTVDVAATSSGRPCERIEIWMTGCRRPDGTLEAQVSHMMGLPLMGETVLVAVTHGDGLVTSGLEWRATSEVSLHRERDGRAYTNTLKPVLAVDAEGARAVWQPQTPAEREADRHRTDVDAVRGPTSAAMSWHEFTATVMRLARSEAASRRMQLQCLHNPSE